MMSVLIRSMHSESFGGVRNGTAKPHFAAHEGQQRTHIWGPELAQIKG